MMKDGSYCSERVAKLITKDSTGRVKDVELLTGVEITRRAVLWFEVEQLL